MVELVQILEQFIGSYGFPIACCAYMMITMNKTLEKNTESTNNLCSLISMLLDREGINNEQ